MTITTIIFDWDGTLAQTLHLWIDGYTHAFARRDMHHAPETIAAEFFSEHHRVADRHPHLDFAPIVDEARAHVFEAAARVNLYDQAHDTLAALTARGLRLGLVSSSGRELLLRGLGAHDLDRWFGSIIAGDDGFGHKPDPLPFAETLRRLGARAEQTLIIGDSHVDVLAGKALGCRTVWFTPPQNHLFQTSWRDVAQGADHHVTDLMSLLDHV